VGYAANDVFGPAMDSGAIVTMPVWEPVESYRLNAEGGVASGTLGRPNVVVLATLP
jgi:hypothetical protein